ncbi:MAG: amidohydrolase [Bacteroidales bacterium]
MEKHLLPIAFIPVILFAMLTGCNSKRADIIYTNAHVYTMDEDKPVAAAIAVRGNRFLFVGNNEEAMEYAGDKTRVVDLERQTVIPGLTESHMHFESLCRNLYAAPLDVYWMPLEDLLATIEEATAQASPGEWIIASGYNDALWEEEPHRRLLDRVSPDNPVVLRRYCGHAHLVNSKALEVAGIDHSTSDPEAGTIVRDDEGQATGVLVSAAGWLVNQHVPEAPELSEEERTEALGMGSEAALAAGLTTIHDLTASTMDDIHLRCDAYEEEALKVRLMDAVTDSTAMEVGRPLIGLYDDRYTVRWVKKFIDGSLGGRGAALKEPYEDAPEETGSLRELGQDIEAYSSLVADLLELGYSTRTHSIGDRGNHVTLNAFEKAMEMTGKTPEEARLVVEHAQILSEDDLMRFADRNVIASMQPIHATEDMLFAEARIGSERASRAYAWRSILDNGGIIAAGSDYAVSPYNPFYGMHAAVTRQDREGNPSDGWFPEQRLSREEALKAYTVWPAYLEFSENEKGAIKRNNLADFVVIDRDYFDIPEDEIHEIEVLRTVLGGETVYIKGEEQ